MIARVLEVMAGLHQAQSARTFIFNYRGVHEWTQSLTGERNALSNEQG
jgi:hypothetical protein